MTHWRKRPSMTLIIGESISRGPTGPPVTSKPTRTLFKQRSNGEMTLRVAMESQANKKRNADRFDLRSFMN